MYGTLYNKKVKVLARKKEVQINDKNEVEFIMIDNSTQIEKLMSSGSGYERTIASLALRAVLSKVCSLPKPANHFMISFSNEF